MYAIPTDIPAPIDFAIITIIPEERDAVKKIIGTTRSFVTNRNWYYGQVTSEVNGEKHTVIMVRSRDRGNIPATNVAKDVLNLLKPTNLLVVGIGGGVKGRDNIALGDVVAHTDMDYYELSKHIDGKKLPRPMLVAPPAPLLVGTAERIVSLEKPWWREIRETRPTGDGTLPKVLQESILVGDKLLADPESPVLIELLKANDKAVAVEMESGGVARAVLEEFGVWFAQFLVIRGISDYCNVPKNQKTRDDWKVYAAESAAAFALALIRNTEAPPRVTSQYDRYKRSLGNLLTGQLSGVKSEFKLTYSMGSELALPGKTLAEKPQETYRLILQGYAGGGKSLLIRKCAVELLRKNAIPLVFDLKQWTGDHARELDRLVNQGADLPSKFDVLLRVCITDVNREMLTNFPTDAPRVLFVDGINEVFRQEDSKQIIDVLNEYIRTSTSTTSVVMTDRLSQRSPDSKWSIAKLDLLDISEVRRAIQAGFDETAFEELTANDLKLLSIPYYLNIALRSTSPQLGSAAKAIEGYFLDQVKLDEARLVKLSIATFKALLKAKSSSFDSAKFFKSVGEEISQRLQGAGAMKVVADGFIQFEHQLHQDYLLSKYLASHPKSWNAVSFDAVSFDSQSVESLEMALEQLPDFAEGDEFLTRLYDWNWGATVSCLANAAESGIRNYSHEMWSVIVAVVAEKLTDPILRTEGRAITYLSLFDDRRVEALLKLHSFKKLGLSDIFAIVTEVDSKETWFLKWRELFTREPDEPINEMEIKSISSSNPVLGWTASNVIRRFSLTENDLRHLRGIYDAASSYDEGQSLSWRVVHALGRTDTAQNVALLVNVVKLGDKWPRYGAVRSLVEIAAISKSSERRREVIRHLSDLLGSLDEGVLREMSNALFYRGSPPDWHELAVSLVERIRDVQSTESDRDTFSDVLVRLKSFLEERS